MSIEITGCLFRVFIILKRQPCPTSPVVGVTINPQRTKSKQTNIERTLFGKGIINFVPQEKINSLSSVHDVKETTLTSTSYCQFFGPFRNLTVLSKRSFNPKIDQSQTEISFRMIRKWVLSKIIFGKLFLRKYLYL